MFHTPPTAAVTRVVDAMTLDPVTCPSGSSVDAALSRAQAHKLHHFPVVGPEGELVGLVCVCNLQRAKPKDLVSSCMSSPVYTIAGHAPLEDAADLMREHGVGCLAVVSPGGHLMGVVTRRDLRQAGVLSRERGLDACAACGSTHGLMSATERDAPVFCGECLERRGGEILEFYDTLGGSG